tara:strand:+ start:554 stop:1024 length:471 start_codon:yes stop_codon:yes gene_type:complete
MNGQQKLQEFEQAIEDWKTSKHLKSVKAPEKDSRITTLLNMDADIMRGLNPAECLMYAYELYAYAEYVETVKVKEKNILEWADSSIWYIIGGVLEQYGGQYAKWQQRYYAAVKENPLADQILVIKKHAEARVRTLEGCSERILKMADILTNLSRRK